MEMYNVFDGNMETYLIQGTEPNAHLTSPPVKQLDAMYNEGAPEFVVEQGLYYPTATNYGYICTGFESPSDWDDHHRIFGLDGQEVQYTGRGAQAVDNISHGKALSHRNQLKMALTSSNGLSNFGSSAHGGAAVEKIRSNFHYGRVSNDVNGSPDALTEQNRGPRTNKSKNHLAVKAYTTRAGESDAQGNIIIYTDEYNKDDFPVDYVNAKFFVIKSYSEDDVHKGIKYNVWSSTSNGNKKLQSAYEDAQRIASGEPRGCPIFLFFSVNASGQFCGVAEMTGPIDFHKDMDFWQQDKWSGSFPVKWHIIKDVPNPNFRHIILENNENKPVTNSRDTQEMFFSTHYAGDNLTIKL